MGLPSVEARLGIAPGIATAARGFKICTFAILRRRRAGAPSPGIQTAAVGVTLSSGDGQTGI